MYAYIVNKPYKVVNQKSGYISSQDTTPNRPITILEDGRKILDVYSTADKNPIEFAKALVELMNEDNG